MVNQGDLQALLFDKDGTLFAFEATWGGWAQQVLLELACGDSQAAAAAGRMIGFDCASRSFDPDSPVIAGTLAATAKLLQRSFPSRSVSDMVAFLDARSRHTPQIEATPLAPLFTHLKAAGYRLGIATNDSESATRTHIAGTGIEGSLDFIAGFDTGFGGKPGIGMLEAFCRQVGVAATGCAMIGDSIIDMMSGRRAGMMTVGVLTGYATRDDLEPMADAVLADIGHLPNWLLHGRQEEA